MAWKVGVYSRVTIFDERMYTGGGVVDRWVGKVTRRFGREARAHAPIRTGRLRAGIRTSQRRAALKILEGRIGSTANHTMFVLHGTAYDGTGYIYTHLGYALRNAPLERRLVRDPETGRLKARPGTTLAVGKSQGRETHRAFRVHGQRENNFFREAWFATAATYPAIGPCPF
jgi:hypothetical protein